MDGKTNADTLRPLDDGSLDAVSGGVGAEWGEDFAADPLGPPVARLTPKPEVPRFKAKKVVASDMKLATMLVVLIISDFPRITNPEVPRKPKPGVPSETPGLERRSSGMSAR